MRPVAWSLLLSLVIFFAGPPAAAQEAAERANPPIYIAFLWHMHQPIYWPYEPLTATDAANRYTYSVTDIHNQRTGPYTNWPANAVWKGIDAGLPHLGTQVSFSGSLVENLNTLKGAGNGNFQNWQAPWLNILGQSTALGNPRMDLVGFGYHHPLMGLIEAGDIRRQIQAHKAILAETFGGAYSKGIFPPENAFVPRMIPALAAEGLDWVLVDNIHFERAAANYPFNTGGNLYEANRADVLNTDPGDWLQLNDLWAPTPVSAQWARQPHFVEYTDPATGETSRIIAVPTDRYLGNEDGRGGFGALNYEAVMSQFEPYNTDPDHPILLVLHHDGDNFGGGSESYYNGNFQAFVNWLLANPERFVATTIQDYLDQFPPHPDDVIHVEAGSWSGADNGDPEFKKWLGDPFEGYSPDRNSWGVITAAKNYVATADQVAPNDPNTAEAWRFLLNGQASDYWYWDGSLDGIWDAHPTRAANQAIAAAQQVVDAGTDATPPTLFVPQREPYNPGGTEWGLAQPNDFSVWTYAYDVSGLADVTLYYRLDADGMNDPATIHNETYDGGADVGDWVAVPMAAQAIPPQTNLDPTVKAPEYSAEITGLTEVLVDYYVAAQDTEGNRQRSPIQHVWVGANTTGGGDGGAGSATVSWSPANPTVDDVVTITITEAGLGANLHWGVNDVGSTWQTPAAAYWPSGSALFNGSGPAIESPMDGPTAGDTLTLQVGPFNDAAQAVERVAFVVHYSDDTWDNNGGQDYHITVSGNDSGGEPVDPAAPFAMDDQLDAHAKRIASDAGRALYVGWNGTDLYVATDAAAVGQGGDIFLLIAEKPGALGAAPWAKGGQVAAWDVFLANESTNNWTGWFDQVGTVQQSAGARLEGTVALAAELGHVPDTVYVALARYGTDDGGALLGQLPHGNGDAHLDADEWYRFVLGGEAAEVSWQVGWNLVGLPLLPDTTAYTTLFPQAVSGSLFGYDGQYTAQDHLAPGAGYWLRFEGASSATVQGTPAVSTTQALSLGWNLLAGPGCTATLEDPANLVIAGTAFRFDNGYQPAEAFAAGRGYWVRTREAGTVSLVCGMPGRSAVEAAEDESAGELVLTDAEGNRQTLRFGATLDDASDRLAFSLPPLPPLPAFDVRFDGGYRLTPADLAEDTIHLQGVAYPLTVTVPALPLHPGPFTLTEVGGPGRSAMLEAHTAFTITDPQVTALRLQTSQGTSLEATEVPTAFALEPNYPNPFNPTTTLRFGLPTGADATLAVYDVLGRRVATLVDRRLPAGWHTVRFDATGLPSGVYFYRLAAGAFQATGRMLLVK